MPDILVTSYINPDLDGYGGSFAYAELLRAQGKDAAAGVFGTPLPEVMHVLETYGIEQMSPADPSIAQIVIVDSSEPQLLDPRIPLDHVTEIIDHHEANSVEKFANAKAQIELIGAAATLVGERFQAASIRPSREAALLLLGGIVSNTLNYQSPLCGPRDLAMGAWLGEIAAAPASFGHDMLVAKSDLSEEKLGRQLQADGANKIYAGKSVTICQLEIIGAARLVETRIDEILGALEKIRLADRAEHILLNIVDLEEALTIFVTADPWARTQLEKSYGLRFEEGVARHPARVLRKQIWLPLKQAIES